MKKRLIGIDFLRVLSAFIVFLYHTIIHIGCGYGMLMNFMRSGSMFMITFFIISGFSIFYTYSDKNLMLISQIKTYYVKRIIGIIPLYYVVSILYAIFIAKESLIDNIILFPIEMLGLQTVFPTVLDYTHNSGTWFISCLLICYLIYPLIQEIYKQISLQMKFYVIWLCAFILMYSPIIELRFEAGTYHNPFFRCLQFVIGAGIASILNNKQGRARFRFLFTWKFFFIELVILVIGVSALFPLFSSFGRVYVWIALPISILMVISLSGVKVENKIVLKVVGYLSSISYDFYLAQFFTWKITKMILKLLTITNNGLLMIISIIISLTVCVFISVIFHELIEKPISKYLKKYVVIDNH